MSESPEGFVCTKCGDCCRNIGENAAVFLNGRDVKRISDHLSVSIETFTSKYCSEDQWSVGDKQYQIYRFVPNGDGSCQFLSPDNSCSIHEVKPHQCRWTPYKFMYRSNAFDYACMKGVEIDADWNSSKEDAEFLDGISVLALSRSASPC